MQNSNTNVNPNEVKGINCLEDYDIEKYCSNEDAEKLKDWLSKQNVSPEEFFDLTKRFKKKQISIFPNFGGYNIPTLTVKVFEGPTFECFQLFSQEHLKKLFGKMNWWIKKTENKHLFSAPIH